MQKRSHLLFCITYLGRTLNLSSVLLPSCYHLATILLPSSYLLPTHYFVFTKRIFSTQFITNSELSIFKFQVSIQNCINIRFLEPTSLLSPYYPLATPYLKRSFFAIFLHSNALFCISIPIKYTIFWLAFMNVVIPPN